jgi:hypothetical protein
LGVSVLLEMAQLQDFLDFYDEWQSLKRALCDPGLLKEKSLQESAQIVARLHSQFQYMVKFFYKNFKSFKKDCRENFQRLEWKFHFFVHDYQNSFKKYQNMRMARMHYCVSWNLFLTNSCFKMHV